MNCFIRLLLIPMLALLCSGCIWNRAKINDTAVAVRAASVRPGVTRAEDLPTLLGAVPSAVIPMRDGRTLYTFAYGDAKTEGLSLLLLTMTKTNSCFSAVYVMTDANGVVERVQCPPKEELPWETWPFGD